MAKNISSKQFAEEIGIQPSGMSHIMSGRNKPSLEFVRKVVTRYPEIDINWLLFGKGEMYVVDNLKPSAPIIKNDAVTPAPATTPRPESEPVRSQSGQFSQMGLFDAPVEETPITAQPAAETTQESLSTPSVGPIIEQPTPIATTASVAEVPKCNIDENRVNNSAPALHPEYQNLVKDKKIVKIIVFYEDHSFSEYFPE